MPVHSTPLARTTPPEVADVREARPVYLYYPAEGFGCLYHRTMLNDFFTKFIGESKINSVAEAPLDSYGMVGAGSLIFTQLGRKLTLISQDKALLARGSSLFEFNAITDVNCLHSALDHIPVPADTFDFSWSYERIQAVSNASAVVDELCRVSKAVMIVVPNKYNYGQYSHYFYHRVSGTTCDYVGPNTLMRPKPIREMLRKRGLVILRKGMIDIPWWPLFPELPNLVRRVLGRTSVTIDPQKNPEANPEVVPLSDLSKLRERIEKAAVIERSSWIPNFIKLLFAHSAYVIGCKPRYRAQLGL
jgi:methyltransferase family protein